MKNSLKSKKKSVEIFNKLVIKISSFFSVVRMVLLMCFYARFQKGLEVILL